MGKKPSKTGAFLHDNVFLGNILEHIVWSNSLLTTGKLATALSILVQAEAAGDLRTALGAVREARGNQELLAKMLGLMNDKRHEVDVKTVVNLTIGKGYDARRDEPEEMVVEGEMTSVEAGGRRWPRSFPR